MSCFDELLPSPQNETAVTCHLWLRRRIVRRLGAVHRFSRQWKTPLRDIACCWRPVSVDPGSFADCHGRTLMGSPCRLEPPMTIWVQPRSNERHHGPCITVCRVHGPRILPNDSAAQRPLRVIPANGFSVADLRAVSHWIRLNETTIVAHWEGRISAIEFGRRLQKLP